MTPVYPWAELYSSRPFIWYVTRYPLSNFLILHSMTLVYPQAELYSSRPSSSYVTWWPFDNFSFCTWWPRYTPGLNSTHRYFLFDMSHNALQVIFYLHLMTPERLRADLYSSRTSICHKLLNTSNSILCSDWSNIWWRFNPFSIYAHPTTEVFENNGSHFENGSHLKIFKGHKNCQWQLSIAIRAQNYHYRSSFIEIEQKMPVYEGECG